MFSVGDASAILATRVPNHVTSDRVAWSKSKDGQYDVKTGYRLWHDLNMEDVVPSQSKGWRGIWSLDLSHKMKIFLWHFCRKNLSVRNRLRSKGVDCPIICPMCNVDIEHLMHIFLDCSYARSYWQYVGLQYNWQEIFSTDEWLLNKLDVSPVDEVGKVCITLYGIWMDQNRKVWDKLELPGSISMKMIFTNVQEWREATKSQQCGKVAHILGGSIGERKWRPPDHGLFKINVDASWFSEAKTFSIGMVLRDHVGKFIEGRTLTMSRLANAFEAKSIGIREALSWVKSREDKGVVVKSDSKLTVDAINEAHEYVLEVGHVIDQCKILLHSLPEVSVKHIRKQANKVAYGLAKMPCSINYCNVFTSPPTHLVETILIDASF